MVRGPGTEFDSLRDYVRGDDVRSIDWRATARRSDLVVRTWRPERDRRVVIIIDSGRTSAARIDNDGNGFPDNRELRLYDTGEGFEVECASCHDPHGVPSGAPGSTFNPTFLRVPNAGSAVCLTCHAK